VYPGFSTAKTGKSSFVAQSFPDFAALNRATAHPGSNEVHHGEGDDD
jgi:hypothetical protein